MAEPERFVAETRVDGRTWLERNRARASGVWRVTHRKERGKPYLASGETVATENPFFRSCGSLRGPA